MDDSPDNKNPAIPPKLNLTGNTPAFERPSPTSETPEEGSSETMEIKVPGTSVSSQPAGTVRLQRYPSPSDSSEDSKSETMAISVPSTGPSDQTDAGTIRLKRSEAPADSAPATPAATVPAPIESADADARNTTMPITLGAPGDAAASTLKPLSQMAHQAKNTLAKKEKSKLPLEAAIGGTPEGTGGVAIGTPVDPGASTGGTIRLKRADAPSPAAPGDAKRKTSRISLEAAMAPQDQEKEPSAPSAPKTIRLKRPTEAATVQTLSPEAVGAKKMRETPTIEH